MLRGHGTTPNDLQNHTFADWLDGARAELRECERTWDGVILCGFSMGSLLALELATERPLRGLVLLGCALRLSAPLRATFALAARTGWKLPDAYIPRPLGPDIRDKTLAASIGGYDRHPIRAAMEVYRAGRALAPHLGEVKCPTLILHGELDRVCDVAGAREVAAALGTPDVRVRTYPRSAHMLALDFDRDDVARDVISFCERRGSS
jgi:carboxylesterase